MPLGTQKVYQGAQKKTRYNPNPLQYHNFNVKSLSQYMLSCHSCSNMVMIIFGETVYFDLAII
jgi:hypothetical protein